MAMVSVVMKHLGFVLMVSWLSVMNGKAVGQVIPTKIYGNIEGFPTVDQQLLIEDAQCKINNTAHCPCQEGFIRLASGKCYFFSFKRKSWPEALASCLSVGSTLAYPMNVVEDVVLATYLKDNFNGLIGWYLGGTDLGKVGDWVWVHNNASIDYFDWTPGQPDLSVERCLQYYDSRWQWNNINCNGLYPFVCQQLTGPHIPLTVLSRIIKNFKNL